MRCTIDASVLLKLVINEEYSENALKLVSDPRTIMHGPSILFSEIGSALYKISRRKIIDKSYAITAFENIMKLPIEIQGESLSVLPRILEQSLRLELHFYDCLYIYTAKKTGSTLISSDDKLLDVATKECSTKSLRDI